MPEERTIFFIHIPKTAGVSLGAILRQSFKPEEIYPTPVPPELGREGDKVQVVHDLRTAHAAFDPDVAKRYRLVMGHWDYGLRARAPWLTPVTILRDPLERLISHYKFIARTDDHWNRAAHDKIINRKLSLREFYSDPQIRQATENFQARQLAGCIWSLRGPRPSDAEVLERALEHLHQCAWVGLTERFRESVLMLCHLFILRPVHEYYRLNASPDTMTAADLTQDTVSTMREISQLDLELYEHGKRLYNEQLTRMLQELYSGASAGTRHVQHGNSPGQAQCAGTSQLEEGRCGSQATSHRVAVDRIHNGVYAKRLFNDELWNLTERLVEWRQSRAR